jgi:hypothetical protein
MISSRRNFLNIAATSFAAAWGGKLLAAQRPAPIPMPGQIPTPMPRIPGPGRPFPGDPTDNIPVPEHKISPAQQLKMNHEEIQKDMEKLKAAVGDLEKEFNANDTTAVLSVGALHKTEEIEKLAKHIRSLVRG